MQDRKIRILLVEDELLLLQMYSELLDEAGFDVTQASNGDNAWLRICAGVAFDVLLTDVRMAGQLDGIKLAYKCQTAHPSIPRILMSGFMMSDVMVEPGLATFIRKPFTAHQVVNAIMRSLTQSLSTKGDYDLLNRDGQSLSAAF